MASQQTKRRRKRHNPAGADATRVRPKGILGLFGNVRLFYILGAAIMLGSLGVGGLFGSNVLTGSGGHGAGRTQNDFVLPDDDEDAPATDVPDTSSTRETRVRQYAAPPPLAIDLAGHYVATLMTAKGDVEIDLFAGRAPQTVNNFLFLARDGFYDGLPFHAVFPGFSAQAGDPTGTGRGGPGYELPQEAPAPFERGLVGMANASQFFIALSGGEALDGYTPFGRVIAGLDVIELIEEGDLIESIDVREGTMAGAEPASPEGGS